MKKFNPILFLPEEISETLLRGKPSGTIIQSIGPNQNIMISPDGEIIGVFDNYGNPIN